MATVDFEILLDNFKAAIEDKLAAETGGYVTRVHAKAVDTARAQITDYVDRLEARMDRMEIWANQSK